MHDSANQQYEMSGCKAAAAVKAEGLVQNCKDHIPFHCEFKGSVNSNEAAETTSYSIVN